MVLSEASILLIPLGLNYSQTAIAQQQQEEEEDQQQWLFVIQYSINIPITIVPAVVLLAKAFGSKKKRKENANW